VRSLFTIVLVLILSATSLAAQSESGTTQDGQEVVASVDWSTGMMTVTIRRPMPRSGANLPAAISRVQADIERDAPAIILSELRGLTYDSLRTVNELLIEDQGRIQTLVAAAQAAKLDDTRATIDLRYVEARFVLDLRAELIARLARHGRPVQLEPVLRWIATADHTGIVINATGALPVHGTSDERHVEPALFPGIYYRDRSGDGVERLMEADYVEREYLDQWGPVSYTSDVFDAEFSGRVGSHPLRIVADGAFGRYPTDIVISYQNALRILASEHNRALIAEGRIAIVLDPEQLEQ
jgi:hypothetical protein